MDYFQYHATRLYGEGVYLGDIAERFGTPCYVYSRATLEHHWRAFDSAFNDRRHLICFAVKANSNLAVLNVLARLGSGFDIVSAGELQRVLAAGGKPHKVVFSGIGKQCAEMRQALLAGIRCFNVESEPELERLNDIAGEVGVPAPVALRVNPDVDPGTHPYIATGLRENKFGIPVDEAQRLYARARDLPHLQVRGVACHIGSQITSLEPFLDALDRVLALVDDLAHRGIIMSHLDLGGGLGIRYDRESPPSPAEYGRALKDRLGSRALEILLEPGRAIAANAGMLLTRVQYLKSNGELHFALVDAAMNDLIRPALYGAWQEIEPVEKRPDLPTVTYDVVGPVCETGDFLGRQRALAVRPGDLLAVRSAGAYGFVMSSNYNSRPRAPEIMVDGSELHLVRPRETVDDLIAGETLLPE